MTRGTKSMTDQYEYWRNALAGNFGPIHDGDAHDGFYRKRRYRGGPFAPVAIFHHDGEQVALVDGQSADPTEIWSYVCQHPVSEEAYRAAAEGKGWPDLDEGVAEQSATRHNSDPIDDLEALNDQIEGALERLSEYETIDSDEKQAKAQSLRARLNELSREADKRRKAEKQPHLNASKEVDAKWQPLVKSAKFGADAVAQAMSAYETEKLRQQREIEPAAEAAENEVKTVDLVEDPTGPVGNSSQSVSEPAQGHTIRGGYGRGASVVVVKTVSEIVDQAALYTFLSDHPDLRRCMLQLAQRAVSAGLDVPGVCIEEEAKVA